VRIMTESAGPVQVIEETSAYWRVVFGLQREADFEKRWPAVLGTLLEFEISDRSLLEKKGSEL
jgi:hypothetical protein